MQHYFRSHIAQFLLGFVFIVFPIFTALADAPVNDSPIDAGIQAVDSENYSEAFAIFLKLAEAGNAEAQHNLAMLYRTGKGVKKDLNASFKWFQQAAEQGVPDAQYYLAYMYENGEGAEKSLQKAIEWYRQAAEHGQGLAQINLGVIYADGAGVPQDIKQAYLWFHAAAAQGYKAAFENRLVIETALKNQGEEGKAVLELLKQQARGYFQQYVQPFVQKTSLYRDNKSANSKH